MTSRGLEYAEDDKGHDIPQACEEEVDIVDIGDLFYKGWDSLDKSLAVVLYEDIQVDAVFPACCESLCIIPTVRFIVH